MTGFNQGKLSTTRGGVSNGDIVNRQLRLTVVTVATPQHHSVDACASASFLGNNSTHLKATAPISRQQQWQVSKVPVSLNHSYGSYRSYTSFIVSIQPHSLNTITAEIHMRRTQYDWLDRMFHISYGCTSQLRLTEG
jgi:hypothetical protein